MRRGASAVFSFLPANSNGERDEEGRSHLVSRDRNDIRPRALGYPEQEGVQAQWGWTSPSDPA